MTRLRKSPTVLTVSLACLLTACSTGSKSGTRQAPGRSASITSPEPAPLRPGSPINPRAVIGYLEREGANLVRQGKASTNLLAQTPPRTCRLRLTPASPQVLSPPQLVQKAEISVGVVGEFVIKGNAVRFNSFSSGFFLTESGAFVICGHVLEKPAGKGYVVMTRDGRLWPMRAVLAAGSTNDLAIVQVEGGGFTPLPVAPAAPIGSAVWVLSHPLGFFYTFTSGIVSGYIDQHDGQTARMSITADYAVGSSGAPVLDEHGAVVGVASETDTLFSGGTKNSAPQMVLKLCVPSAALLNLIEQE